MGDLLVVTGPPGAGKSTVASLLAEHGHRSALVPGDDFFAFLRRGAIPPWLPESHDQNTAVVEAAAAAAGRLVRHCDVFYDGVVGPWFLPTFLEHSGLGHLDYAVLLPPLDVCLQRVRTRSGHPFADLDAAEHMWCDFHDAGIESRHVLSEVVSLAELTRLLAERRRSGALRHPGSPPGSRAEH
jgi:cytidylate kinase